MKSLSRFEAIGCTFLLLLLASSAEATKWSRRYITSLEDSAFAAIETTQRARIVTYPITTTRESWTFHIF